MKKSIQSCYIKPREISYVDFPESQISACGMTAIEADFSQPYCQCEKIQYAVKSGMALHLNIIRPVKQAEQTAKLPLIVYVQGSAWLPQNLESKIVQLGRICERGFVVAIVEYRPSAIAAFPAQVKDAKTACRYLINNADSYGIDTDKVVLWGDSSGGHTVSMMGLTLENPELDDESPTEQPLNIKAVIDYYGPVDISKMNEEPSTLDHQKADSPEGLLIGGVNVIEHLELAQKTNPINYIAENKMILPFMIFHGSKDRLVPFGQSVMLFNALKEAGGDVEFYQIKGADHGQAPFWSHFVLDIVENFIRTHI